MGFILPDDVTFRVMDKSDQILGGCRVMSKDRYMMIAKFSTSEMIDERDVIPSFDCVLEMCLDKTFNRSIGDRKEETYK
jgi:hypothetical protein